MKTICLLQTYNDNNWIGKYCKSKSPVEDISIIATTFEGRMVADELKLNYKTYEDEAWKISKFKLLDRALLQSHQWHKIDGMEHIKSLDEVRYFKEYPLLDMHMSTLLIPLYEIFQAFEFMGNVFELEKPDKVVIGHRANPLLYTDRFFMMTENNGLEREAAKVLCENRNIELLEMRIYKNKSTFFQKVVKGLNNPELIVKKVIHIINRNNLPFLLNRLQKLPHFKWNPQLNGPKILIFTWCGYYLKQISGTFDILLAQKCRIGLIIQGGRLLSEEEKMMKQKGICFYYESDLGLDNKQMVLREWKSKCEKAFKGIENNVLLKNYFSGEKGSYYNGLAREALQKELVVNIPETIANLMLLEAIIDDLNPDLLLSHFLGIGSCEVMPARIKGIPTLTLSHGVALYNNVLRDFFSTQYYAVTGDLYKDALVQIMKCSPEIIFPVGEPRLEQIKIQSDNNEMKRIFGFDPDKPLCIFTDTSTWSQSFDYRHSTFYTVQKIISLKKHFPNLQIVYRVHHGANYICMQKYFDNLNIPGITFQISPDPLFTDIVQAADVVISHNTSAITESLLCGVRVIYLCALSTNIEQSYVGCDMIKITDSFEKLPTLVSQILQHPMSREKVLEMAQPFFDRVICGNDGKAVERLANLMLKLATLPKEQWKKGFEDWQTRVDAAGKTKLESHPFFEDKRYLKLSQDW